MGKNSKIRIPRPFQLPLTEKEHTKLWSNIQVRSRDECWPYIPGVGTYGRIWLRDDTWYPHLLVFLTRKGPIEPGNTVQHTCKNPRCCNPDHLFQERPNATTDYNIRERFEPRVRRGATAEECDIWIGPVDVGGYGTANWNGKLHKAHRIAWYLETGELPPPKGKQMLCHACNNPRCVKIGPGHVYLGTGYTNARDRDKAGTTSRGITHGSRTKPESIRKGTLNGRAELSEDDVVCIRRTAANFKGQRGLIPALARHFNKDDVTILDIIDRRLWRHVPENAHPHIGPLSAEQVKKIPIHGEFSPFTKVSDLQVREIRFLYDQAGGRYGTLARLSSRYGLKRSQLLRIARRESRAEVPDSFETLGPLQPLFP